jgi:diketogulonate reductase-like aldo/keto reductase
MDAKSPSIKLHGGVEMPQLGLGVFQSPPDQALAAVEAALRSGYRLIDTAAAYMNEAQVGEGIRRSGLERSDVFVTTKLWISDYGACRRAASPQARARLRRPLPAASARTDGVR